MFGVHGLLGVREIFGDAERGVPPPELCPARHQLPVGGKHHAEQLGFERDEVRVAGSPHAVEAVDLVEIAALGPRDRTHGHRLGQLHHRQLPHDTHFTMRVQVCGDKNAIGFGRQHQRTIRIGLLQLSIPSLLHGQRRGGQGFHVNHHHGVGRGGHSPQQFIGPGLGTVTRREYGDRGHKH